MKNEPNQVVLKGKCISCQKVAPLTSQQIRDGEDGGMPLSTCCYMPMTIEEAIFSTSRKSKKK